jgi:predicted signal transduction protein with EAL and GGDEF domain
MTLVAEGVETKHNLTELAGLGCDVAQGYHLSRAIPADAFDAWSAGRPITPAHPQKVGIPGRASEQPDPAQVRA